MQKYLKPATKAAALSATALALAVAAGTANAARLNCAFRPISHLRHYQAS